MRELGFFLESSFRLAARKLRELIWPELRKIGISTAIRSGVCVSLRKKGLEIIGFDQNNATQLQQKCFIVTHWRLLLWLLQRQERQFEYSSAQNFERVFLTSLWDGVLCELDGSKNWGQVLKGNRETAIRFVVAEKMDGYDANATAAAMSMTAIENLVSGLDRAELIEMLNLGVDWPLVADIKGIHPPSLSAPKTLRISAHDCPFLQAGTSSECCTGCVISRTGHLTISMPCYRTDLLADNSVCARCEQLWASPGEDGNFALDPKTMDKAADFYKPGKTGVMKKWQEMVGASAIFEEEVQSA